VATLQGVGRRNAPPDGRAAPPIGMMHPVLSRRGTPWRNATDAPPLGWPEPMTIPARNPCRPKSPEHLAEPARLRVVTMSEPRR
jgi:hypothetical protein